jgi:two-component system sensor histidine kinase KdpD
LLDMTRIEAGVVHPKLEWCDVSELIEAAIDLTKDPVGVHSIVGEIANRLPMVRVDQALLEQCVSNLLLNAAANSPAGSKIIVSARIEDNSLALSVRDQGHGISDSDLPRMFEAFYRGAESRPGGTGLGLAIVDGFVRAHGGNVAAANREPRGAEFVITLPVETLSPDVVEKFA